ncbi:MAG: hypothetical protein ACQEVA_18875 [Myxococcota bacterium]
MFLVSQPVHRALRCLAIASALVFAVACSDNTTDGGNDCPDGQEYNPIKDECEGDIRTGDDGGGLDGGTDATSDVGDTSDDDTTTGDTFSPPPDVESCTPGDAGACASQSSRYVCNEAGDAYELEQCPGEQTCLAGECGDRVCTPEIQECYDESSTRICKDDGSGWNEPEACPSGTVCERGTCRTTCDLGGKGPSYIGCEYVTLDLDQYTDPTTNPKPDEVPHSVVISNPGQREATISFSSPSTAASFNIPDPTVPAGSAKAFQMPRLDVDESGITRRSINIVSSEPVIAHQFNPLNNQSVYSNDASLLLPISTLGTEYYAVNWPTQVLPSLPGLGDPDDQQAYVTVVATESGQTIVDVDSTADIKAGPGVSAISAGSTGSYALNRGEVLNLTANSGAVGADGNDLTGTYIKSSLPVAVFAGHEEAVIGDGSGGDESCCADHLEQQLFPLSTWGNSYIAGLSPGRGTHKDHWRIVSGEDGVTLTTSPAQPDANNVTLNKGDSVTFYSDQDFEIDATGKIMVGQFLVSQQQTSEVVGDPAFLLSVPSAQFRTDYHLLTPENYSTNYVQIIRPTGVAVNLDGSAVSNGTFRAVGSDFEVGHVEVDPGVHTLDSAEPFGIQAYGFDSAVSYGYPGGLNLVGEAPDSN